MGARTRSADEGLTMIYWKSWDDFAQMGGYGLYVWGAYAVTLGTMALEAALVARRRRRAFAEVGEGDSR
jgi:heme exporter protein D